DHPPAAGQRGDPPAPPGGNAGLPSHPGGRGPGPAPVPVAPAPRRRRARPGRPVHRGRPAPARLRQPGFPGQPRDPRPRRARAAPRNYGTTQGLLAWAVPLRGTDPVTGLDGEGDSLIGYRSPMHGPRPRHRLTAARAEEFTFLAERIGSWLSDGIEPHAIGVAARSAALVRQAREALRGAGIRTGSPNGRGGTTAGRAGTPHAMKR